MVATVQLQNFFMGLEQPIEQLFKTEIDKESLYHLDHLDSIEARTVALVSSPDLMHGLEIFGSNIATLNFIHTSLIDIVIDKEDVNFGKITAEDESDCYDFGSDYPIHAKLTYVDGFVVEKPLHELIDSDDADFAAITDIMKKYMPYSVLRELIENIDLKPMLTDKVISKIIWPKHHSEK